MGFKAIKVAFGQTALAQEHGEFINIQEGLVLFFWTLTTRVSKTNSCKMSYGTLHMRLKNECIYQLEHSLYQCNCIIVIFYYYFRYRVALGRACHARSDVEKNSVFNCTVAYILHLSFHFPWSMIFQGRSQLSPVYQWPSHRTQQKNTAPVMSPATLKLTVNLWQRSTFKFMRSFLHSHDFTSKQYLKNGPRHRGGGGGDGGGLSFPLPLLLVLICTVTRGASPRCVVLSNCCKKHALLILCWFVQPHSCHILANFSLSQYWGLANSDKWG